MRTGFLLYRTAMNGILKCSEYHHDHKLSFLEDPPNVVVLEKGLIFAFDQKLSHDCHLSI